METVKTVALTDADAAFVEAQVAAGGFRDEGEVVRAGLRLLAAERAELAELRAAIALGEADVAAGRVQSFQPGELAAMVRAGMRGNVDRKR